MTKRIKLTVDLPGRFSLAYFAVFLSSLHSAAAPSDSDDCGKIAEVQGCARATSRSKSTMSGLNSNSNVVVLVDGAHLGFEDNQTN